MATWIGAEWRTHPKGVANSRAVVTDLVLLSGFLLFQTRAVGRDWRTVTAHRLHLLYRESKESMHTKCIFAYW